ncbi:sulfatase-like hydrolase/transferase, partial [Aporhodopirellula aestuarii]
LCPCHSSLATIALAFISVWVGSDVIAATPAEQTTRPNVLFIISDDLGDRLACYGDPVAVTPHLDRLAKKGVIFANNFCQFPTCGPSRASMLSGLYPFENGCVSNKNEPFSKSVPDVVSLPALFRNNGYFTARVGKIFHMGIPDGIGSKGGDDDDAWDVAVNNTGYEASLENWKNATHVGKTQRAGVRVVYDNPDIDDEEMADGQGLVDAVRILKENNPDATGKPFFLAYGIYSPHPPMIVPTKHWEATDRAKYEMPFVPGNDRDDIPRINWHVKGPGFDFIPETHAVNYSHAYYAAVHFVDELAGRLIQELENEGLADNTIIVFTGDQGFHLGEHGHWHKSTMFEEAARVPLIVVDPRQKEKGKKCSSLSGLIDIYPTLCELTGVEPLHELSGVSLVPQLSDVHAPGKEYEITMGAPSGYGIRTKRYRYTEWRKAKRGPAEQAMLYDLETDPHEFTNLIDDPAYAEIKQELSEKLGSAIAGGKASTADAPTDEFLPKQDTLPVPPPEGAIVLFDGTDTVEFVNMNGGPVDWEVTEGSLVSKRGKRRTNHIVSNWHFRDADIHAEFMLPESGTGNSGLYIHGLYEMQIIHSEGKDKVGESDMGALYGFSNPLASAGRPRSQWQVYDIRYRAPVRGPDGKITKEGSITAWLNGQKVQDNARFGEPRSNYHPYRYGTTDYLQSIWQRQKQMMVGPLFLQDHDNPVRFRNVWIRPLDDQSMRYESENR